MIDVVIRLGSSLAFVGRRSELARLEAAFSRVRDGHPTMILVAGEAGVGKTRFTNEFSGTARSDGARVMIGGCLDVGGGGLPYAPFAEAFRTIDREPGQPRSPAGSGAAGVGDLHALVADLSGATSRLADDALDPQGTRARLFDSVLAVLARIADERPSILVLEDLHWADGSTRDLIRFLIRNLRAERLLIIGTYRTDELYRDHPFMPLLAELERAAPVERIELRRFRTDEVAEQVEGILGAAPPSEIVDALAERSDGLPFYVEELLAVDPLAGRALPSTLRDILGRRLATLGRPTLELVRAAAAIRGRVEVALLAEVMGVGEATLSPSLREAVDRHVLVALDGVVVPTYTFRHALMQAAAYDDLLPDERVRLHARIADAIDERISRSAEVGLADLSESAAHAFAALDQPRALERSIRAADACSAAGAVREAFEHVNRALAVWDRVPDAPARAGMPRWRALRLAASLASTLGRHDDAVTLAGRALSDPGCSVRDDRVDTLADRFLYGWEVASDEICSTAAVEAYAAVIDTPPDRAKALGVKIFGVEQWREDRMLESATLLEEALAIASSIDDPRGWTEIASSLVHTYADLGYIGRVSELSHRIAAAGSAPDHTLRSLVAAVDTIAGSWAAGRYDEAEKTGVTILEWMSRHNLHIGVRSAARCFLADTYVEMGRLADVERIAEPILGSEAVARPYMQWIRQTLAIAAAWKGDLDAARTHLETLEYGQGPAQYHWVARAEVARAEGRFAGVDEAVRASRSTATQDVIGSCALLALGVAAAADAAVIARRRRRRASEQACAAAAADWLGLLADTVQETRVGGGPGPVIAAFEATARAEIERLAGRSTPAAWQTVVEHWSAIGQSYRAAYGRLRLGEASLLHDRDRASATLELRQARAEAIAVGAARLITEIDTIARDARLTIVDADPSRQASPAEGTRGDGTGASVALTERERAVLRLVAEGHTNREIGDRLSISDKTVSVHVSNAMAKLQSLSRYEAAAAAERLGLLDEPSQPARGMPE